jgi:hypothetical protein
MAKVQVSAEETTLPKLTTPMAAIFFILNKKERLKRYSNEAFPYKI